MAFVECKHEIFPLLYNKFYFIRWLKILFLKSGGGGLEDESIKTTKMSFLQNIIIFTILREIPGGNSTKSFPHLCATQYVCISSKECGENPK